MKKNLLNRIFSMFLVVAMLISLAPSIQAVTNEAEPNWKRSNTQIIPDLSDRLAELHLEDAFEPTDIVRVSIVLEEKSTLEAGYSTLHITSNASAMAYDRQLLRKQKSIEEVISTQALGGEKLDVVWNLTLVGNIISANVPFGKIALIEKVDGVLGVVLENTYEPAKAITESGIETNQFASASMTGFNKVWNIGYTGAGSRIAVIDTGTDTDHISFDNGAFLYALQQNALSAGMGYEEYVASLDLLSEAELAETLPGLNIYERDSSLTADALYLNEKLAFAVNYVDEGSGRLNVTHDNDYQSAHGSHVAGIATANRYVPTEYGYADALTNVNVAGVAPDAQLITMKVFGNTALLDSDYMAAIEDAILLGCDSVNLSLGTLVSGFAYNSYYAELLDFMANTDTVVVASAGNEGMWTDMTIYGTPYADDVNYTTLGSPASYANFFAVASVDNDGIISTVFTVGDLSFIYYENTGYGNMPFISLDTSLDLDGTGYEYVFIDGLGLETDYEGIDLSGKIVFCSRGQTNFSDKANIAVSLGAVGVVVYNNIPGDFGMNLTGYSYTAPCVSISQEYANVIREVSAAQTTDSGVTYYTGSMEVLGLPQAAIFNSAYFTMSSFSSWGVPGDLSIKPEITAPGGLIYSVSGSTPETFTNNEYVLMSGTSMAAPQVAGMVALVAQYLRETGLAEKLDISPRVLAQSLLMSTSVPMLEKTSDSYYSILQQGSGLARVDLATLAGSYIMVDGQTDGKVKAELGDDPLRTGEYTFRFDITNITGEDQNYRLYADLFRQSVYDPGEILAGTPYGFTVQSTTTEALSGYAMFTANGKALWEDEALVDYDFNADGTTNAQDADYLLEYLLGNVQTLNGSGDVNADGNVNTYDAHSLLAMLQGSSLVSVPANGSVTVEVTLTLTDAEKARLDEVSADGVYVQAFVYAQQIAEAGKTGTNHAIPALAFYGNWTDPNMFDRGQYVEMMYGISDRVPYLYQFIGNGNALTIDYGDGGEYYFGGNPLMVDDAYLVERNAFNSQDDSYLKSQYFTLIRNAADMKIEVVNKQTGEVYYSKLSGEVYPAFFNSSYSTWENAQQGINLYWYGTDASGEPVPEDTVIQVRLSAAPEYYENADGSYNFDALGRGATLVTEMTIDNTAPELKDFVLDVENLTLTVTAQDNQYISAAVLYNKSGSVALSATAPNQTTANKQLDIELDLTGVTGSTFQLAIYDYAMNATVYEIELDLPEIERPYFTAYDYQEGVYYGLNADGTSIRLAVSDRGLVMAAEFVDGYVFEVSNGDSLYVAQDSDLNSFQYIGEMDPSGQWAITNFLDLAYNYTDNQLYGLFYSELNSEAYPVLCTIDLFTGALNVLGEMPIDVNNIAIDDKGNFYSVAYGIPSLYTYTLDSLMNGQMTYVGEISYYGTGSFNSLAWDHDADKLYWAYPNTLLEVNPETAEPTLLSYFTYAMVGLYIRPENYNPDRFAPTDDVVSLELDYTENRVLLGSNLLLSATVHPWNISDDSVVWTSADESIATVDENGMVYGISLGTTVITATSTLDPSMSASCTVEVIKLEKTLNGLIWDINGKIWWSEFDVGELPNYTKLSDTPVAEYLAATAFTPEGKLYASTTDLSSGNLSSSLFTVDPETFELTKIGDSEYGYSDIAYAPHLLGGSIMGTYGSYLMVINPETGELYGANSYYQMFMYGLNAIAYAGSDRYQDYGFDTYIDWFFLIDTQGYIYLLGVLADDAGNLYYLEHPATNGGIFAVVNYTTDAIYFGSAHFDGEFLYWSVYNESKDVSTLFAIDTFGSRKIYNLGDFGAGVWPAGGLMELDNPTAGMGLDGYELALEPKSAEEWNAAIETKVTSVEKEPVDSGVTAKAPALELLSVVEPMPDENYVSVAITPVDAATNGTISISFDSAALKVVSVTGSTEAFAYTVEDGVIEIAFASAEALDVDAVLANIVFEPLTTGNFALTLVHEELNDGVSGEKEMLFIQNDGLLGDVNRDGKINTTDAKLIMQYELKLIGEEDLLLAAADVNGDGTVNTTDAKMVMQLELGLIENFG